MVDIASIPWEIIILHPFGMALFVGFFMALAMVIVIFIKTPAFTLLRASFGKGLLLINPSSDKTLSFRVTKQEGSLLHVKKRGFYTVDPDDVYIERGSRTPMAIAYGQYGVSINPEAVKYAEKLKAMGIKNYKQLMTYYENGLKYYTEHVLKEQDQAKKQAMIDDFNSKWVVQIDGETLSIDKIVDYFNRNERADYTEAEIQRRTSAEASKKTKQGPGDVLKWLIIFGVFMTIVAVAYAIITNGGAQQIQNVVNTGSKVITGTVANASVITP